ncbi:MAG: VWA domain-containing protein [Acidobacteriota bacterium]|nr:VWA domain-containing protein [Acidobacteriota bacterium]
MPRVIVRNLMLALSLGLYASAAIVCVNVSAQSKQLTDSSAAIKAPAPMPSPAVRQQAAPIKPHPKGLVGVPVIVTDVTGRYVSDLNQSDIEVHEDGVKQNVTLFQAASEPFSVVLLLDTSVSTQGKLGDIRRAANAFVDQLQKSDRIKVISFDDQVRELGEFSADRTVVKKAIFSAQSGYSTKFYDAMNVALEVLREIDGRKAIVIFSDGVDYRSDYATAESTLRFLEQDGVVVYPIRFSTRAAAEKLAREQAGSPLPTREIVTSTTGSKEPAPGESPSSIPKTGPLGLPSPEEILRRRRETRRNRDRLPPGDRPPGEVGSDLPTGQTDPRVSSKERDRKQATEDPIVVMLDRLYTTADTYLQSVVNKSGGQILRVDEVTSLPGAFSQVANELRSQYFLGYDPANKNRDDQYHLIKVTSTRPGLVVRARAGRRLSK